MRGPALNVGQQPPIPLLWTLHFLWRPAHQASAVPGQELFSDAAPAWRTARIGGGCGHVASLATSAGAFCCYLPSAVKERQLGVGLFAFPRSVESLDKTIFEVEDLPQATALGPSRMTDKGK